MKSGSKSLRIDEIFKNLFLCVLRYMLRKSGIFNHVERDGESEGEF